MKPIFLPRNKIILKTISLIVVQVFLCTAVTYPAPTNSSTLRPMMRCGEGGGKEDIVVTMEAISPSAEESPFCHSQFKGWPLDKGWISKPEYLQWLSNVRNKINDLIGAEKDLIIYYYAIGGGIVKSGTGGAEDIDIISPLLATDFTQLIGTDIAKGNFEIFKRRVRKNLSYTDEINLENILFDQTTKRVNGKNHSIFTTQFTYLNKLRKVKVYYGMDATKLYPPELEKGYNALYSRGNPGLITKMGRRIKSSLINILPNNDSFIIMEVLPGANLKFKGFNEIDLGYTVWAGNRDLVVLTNVRDDFAIHSVLHSEDSVVLETFFDGASGEEQKKRAKEDVLKKAKSINDAHEIAGGYGYGLEELFPGLDGSGAEARSDTEHAETKEVIKSIIEKAGGKFSGIQDRSSVGKTPLVVSIDPLTGTSLAVEKERLSVESIRERLDRSREVYQGL